jgi:CDP-diacylglycerol--glycerol-3-phosphate 3-phosphatidyltransferase
VFDGRFRRGVDRCVKPFGGALVRTGISPDHLTAFGLALSVPTALAVATGRLGVGLALLIMSAVPDLLDGALAKASGRATVRGAFFDSVCDRVADTFVLGGLAWYLQDRHGGHAFVLPFAILGASLLISYERAKAESLGFDAKGGLMERAERVVLLCAGLAFSFLLVPLLWAMLVLTVFTALQRFAKVWRQATGAIPDELRRAAVTRRRVAGDAAAAAAAGDAAARWRPATWFPVEGAAPGAVTAARWRAWRESTGRSGRYARATRRDGAAARWRERRLMREQRSADGETRFGPSRWRGSRRP